MESLFTNILQVNYMRIKLTVFFITLSFMLLISCMNKKGNSSIRSTSNNILSLDTSRYTIIIKDTLVSVKNEEIERIHSLCKTIIDSLNNQNNQIKIDVTRYKFQIIPLKSSLGQSTFWVNAFCSDENFTWKTEILGVEDGGNCYFNSHVNLTTSIYYDLIVNGEA